MPYPVFRKASDLLNSDNVVSASNQLSKALNTAGLGFNLGMNALGNIVGDTKEAALMQQMGDIQDRDQYLMALQDPANREMMNGMGADRLRRIMQARPDKLLQNYQTEVNAQSALASALQRQTMFEEAREAKNIGASLAYTEMLGGKEAAATMFSQFWKAAEGNPVARATLARAAAERGYPISAIPTADNNGQIPQVAMPSMVVNNQTVPLSQQNLDTAVQQAYANLKQYKDRYPQLFNEQGQIEFPNVEKAKERLFKMVKDFNAERGKDSWTLLDPIDSWNTLFQKAQTLAKDNGVPVDFVVASLLNNVELPTTGSRFFGSDLNFKDQGLKEFLRTHGKNLAKDFANMQELQQALPVLLEAQKNFADRTTRLNTVQAQGRTIFGVGSNRYNDMLYRANNRFATEFQPVLRASQTVSKLQRANFGGYAPSPASTPAPAANASDASKAKTSITKATEPVKKQTTSQSKKTINPDDLYGVS